MHRSCRFQQTVRTMIGRLRRLGEMVLPGSSKPRWLPDYRSACWYRQRILWFDWRKCDSRESHSASWAKLFFSSEPTVAKGMAPICKAREIAAWPTPLIPEEPWAPSPHFRGMGSWGLAGVAGSLSLSDQKVLLNGSRITVDALPCCRKQGAAWS